MTARRRLSHAPVVHATHEEAATPRGRPAQPPSRSEPRRALPGWTGRHAEHADGVGDVTTDATLVGEAAPPVAHAIPSVAHDRATAPAPSDAAVASPGTAVGSDRAGSRDQVLDAAPVEAAAQREPDPPFAARAPSVAAAVVTTPTPVVAPPVDARVDTAPEAEAVRPFEGPAAPVGQAHPGPPPTDPAEPTAGPSFVAAVDVGVPVLECEATARPGLSDLAGDIAVVDAEAAPLVHTVTGWLHGTEDALGAAMSRADDGLSGLAGTLADHATPVSEWQAPAMAEPLDALSSASARLMGDLPTVDGLPEQLNRATDGLSQSLAEGEEVVPLAVHRQEADDNRDVFEAGLAADEAVLHDAEATHRAALESSLDVGVQQVVGLDARARHSVTAQAAAADAGVDVGASEQLQHVSVLVSQAATGREGMASVTQAAVHTEASSASGSQSEVVHTGVVAAAGLSGEAALARSTLAVGDQLAGDDAEPLRPQLPLPGEAVSAPSETAQAPTSSTVLADLDVARGVPEGMEPATEAAQVTLAPALDLTSMPATEATPAPEELAWTPPRPVAPSRSVAPAVAPTDTLPLPLTPGLAQDAVALAVRGDALDAAALTPATVPGAVQAAVPSLAGVVPARLDPLLAGAPGLQSALAQAPGLANRAMTEHLVGRADALDAVAQQVGDDTQAAVTQHGDALDEASSLAAEVAEGRLDATRADIDADLAQRSRFVAESTADATAVAEAHTHARLTQNQRRGEQAQAAATAEADSEQQRAHQQGRRSADSATRRGATAKKETLTRRQELERQAVGAANLALRSVRATHVSSVALVRASFATMRVSLIANAAQQTHSVGAALARQQQAIAEQAAHQSRLIEERAGFETNRLNQTAATERASVEATTEAELARVREAAEEEARAVLSATRSSGGEEDGAAERAAAAKAEAERRAASIRATATKAEQKLVASRARTLAAIDRQLESGVSRIDKQRSSGLARVERIAASGLREAQTTHDEAMAGIAANLSSGLRRCDALERGAVAELEAQYQAAMADVLERRETLIKQLRSATDAELGQLDKRLGRQVVAILERVVAYKAQVGNQLVRTTGAIQTQILHRNVAIAAIGREATVAISAAGLEARSDLARAGLSARQRIAAIGLRARVEIEFEAHMGRRELTALGDHAIARMAHERTVGIAAMQTVLATGKLPEAPTVTGRRGQPIAALDGLGPWPDEPRQQHGRMPVQSREAMLADFVRERFLAEHGIAVPPMGTKPSSDLRRLLWFDQVVREGRIDPTMAEGMLRGGFDNPFAYVGHIVERTQKALIKKQKEQGLVRAVVGSVVGTVLTAGIGAAFGASMTAGALAWDVALAAGTTAFLTGTGEGRSFVGSLSKEVFDDVFGLDPETARLVGGLAANALVAGVATGIRDWGFSTGDLYRVVNDGSGQLQIVAVEDLAALGEEGQLAVNGILNDLEAAAATGWGENNLLYGSSEVLLYHNPTSGAIADLVESGLGKLTNTSSISLDLARVLAELDPATLTAHSQGGIIASNALGHLADQGTSLSLHTGTAFGAAIPEDLWTSAIAGVSGTADADFIFNATDPVSVIIGPNIHGIGDVFQGIQGFGELFGAGLPGLDIVSPHSYGTVLPQMFDPMQALMDAAAGLGATAVGTAASYAISQ